MPKSTDSPLSSDDSSTHGGLLSGIPAEIPRLEELKSKEARTRADELRYFMVRTNCVKCRRKVRASVEKLHANLRCPGCGARMHMSEDGTWRAGAHPEVSRDAATAGQAPIARKRQRRLSIPLPSILQRPSAQIVALLLILGGLAIVLLRFADPGAEPLPAGLEQRARLLRSAIVDDNGLLFSQLIDAAAEQEASKWKEIIRDKLGVSGSPRSASAGKCQVLFRNWREKLAAVVVDIEVDGGATLKVVTFWSLDGGDYWRFDGRRSLQDLKLSGR